ncbi:PAS domain-containing protein [Carboxylicivirga sp. RSCT41]|uniref:sensor histidine kinase n=1 Tax=Carboxylicivirga agarovorans TaxID=3417570 RepID=UPI003D328DB4
MFKIKSAFIVLFSLLITFLLIILLAFFGLFNNRIEFARSQIGKFHSIQISDQVQERNEDLTFNCLNYILTGDTTWYMAYQEVSDLSTYRFPVKQRGFELLKDSLSSLGFGNKEYQVLEEAIGLASELNSMESSAMNLINGDNELSDAERRSLALDIVSGEQYLSTKRELIRIIKNFERVIEEQTNEKWQSNIAEGSRLYRLVLWFLISVILFALVAFYLIWRRVKHEEKQDVLFKQGVEKLKLTSEKLLKSEERFTLAVKGAEAIIWDYNVKEETLVWSPRGVKLFGFSQDEIKPSIDFVYSRIHHDDLESYKAHVTEHIEKDTPLNIDIRLYEKNNSLKWYRCRASSSKDEQGRSIRIVGIFTDITESVKREEQHMNAILETEDRERSRIARDIHDSLQQTMSTSLLNFEKVRTSISIEDRVLADKYQTGYNYLKKAITESRTLAHNLMPKVVDQNGVAPAIDALVKALEGSTPITINYYHNMADYRMQLAYEMTIYRIVQEAVNNVVKYSEAKECTIQLLKRDDLVTLTIEDDGLGFEIEHTIDTFGLNSMRTRAEAIGAYFEIESSPGRGTQLLLELTI